MQRAKTANREATEISRPVAPWIVIRRILDDISARNRSRKPELLVLARDHRKFCNVLNQERIRVGDFSYHLRLPREALTIYPEDVVVLELSRQLQFGNEGVWRWRIERFGPNSKNWKLQYEGNV